MTDRPAQSAPRCAICGRPATCLGAYEGAETSSYACDACCGHGCEDGHCDQLNPAPSAPAQSAPRCAIDPDDGCYATNCKACRPDPAPSAPPERPGEARGHVCNQCLEGFHSFCGGRPSCTCASCGPADVATERPGEVSDYAAKELLRVLAEHDAERAGPAMRGCGTPLPPWVCGETMPSGVVALCDACAGPNDDARCAICGADEGTPCDASEHHAEQPAPRPREFVSETGPCACGHDSTAHQQTMIMMKRAGACRADGCGCDAWTPAEQPAPTKAELAESFVNHMRPLMVTEAGRRLMAQAAPDGGRLSERKCGVAWCGVRSTIGMRPFLIPEAVSVTHVSTNGYFCSERCMLVAAALMAEQARDQYKNERDLTISSLRAALERADNTEDKLAAAERERDHWRESRRMAQEKGEMLLEDLRKAERERDSWMDEAADRLAQLASERARFVELLETYEPRRDVPSDWDYPGALERIAQAVRDGMPTE